MAVFGQAVEIAEQGERAGKMIGVTVSAVSVLAMRLMLIVACGRYLGWW